MLTIQHLFVIPSVLFYIIIYYVMNYILIFGIYLATKILTNLAGVLPKHWTWNFNG